MCGGIADLEFTLLLCIYIIKRTLLFGSEEYIIMYSWGDFRLITAGQSPNFIICNTIIY